MHHSLQEQCELSHLDIIHIVRSYVDPHCMRRPSIKKEMRSMHNVTNVTIRVLSMKRNFDPFRPEVVPGRKLRNRVQRLEKEGLVERDSDGGA
jgi:hypothetical protein